MGALSHPDADDHRMEVLSHPDGGGLRMGVFHLPDAGGHRMEVLSLPDADGLHMEVCHRGAVACRLHRACAYYQGSAVDAGRLDADVPGQWGYPLVFP